MIDKLTAIEHSKVGKKIGRLTQPQIAHVDRALRVWLDLPEM